jgi:hypothetical protein
MVSCETSGRCACALALAAVAEPRIAGAPASPQLACDDSYHEQIS